MIIRSVEVVGGIIDASASLETLNEIEVGSMPECTDGRFGQALSRSANQSGHGTQHRVFSGTARFVALQGQPTALYQGQQLLGCCADFIC